MNEKGVETDKAETAMQAAKMATRMLFPWERRQFDGGQLTLFEKVYWIILIPSVAFTVLYALRTNDWEDLKQGRLSPTLEERAVAEASRKREERVRRLEELRRRRMHEERRQFGLRQQQDAAGAAPAPAAPRPALRTAGGDEFDGLDPDEIDRRAGGGRG